MRHRTGIVVAVLALLAGAGALVILPGDPTARRADAAQAAQAANNDISSLIGSSNPALLKQLDASIAPPQVLPAAAQVPEATPEPATAPPAAAAAPDTIVPTSKVGGMAVNLRAGPSSNSATVDVLQPGETVKVGANQHGWVEVTLDDGATGWVYSRYLDNPGTAVADAAAATDPEQPVAEAQPKAVKRAPVPVRATISGADGGDLEDRTAVIANTLTVYADPGDASSSFTLRGGQRVRIAEVRGNWLRVETANGTTAWIKR